MVASLLAILQAHCVALSDDDSSTAEEQHQQPGRRSISRRELAELASRCERHVGTQGGGMDQAVSLLAAAGYALHVQFEPLRAAAVQLPAGAAFVVANSLAPSHKALTAALRCERCR